MISEKQKFYNRFALTCRGLTLIEVLIAMGIAVIVSMALMMIIVNSTGVFYQQSSRVQEGLNTNDALAAIRSSIKQAKSVAVSYTEGSVVYTTGSDQLVLNVLAIDSAGNLLTNTYDSFVIFSDGETLRLKVFPNPLSSRKLMNQVFSTSVNSLNFQYFDSANPPAEVIPASAAKIRVTLALKQKAGVGFVANTATSEASLRND